MKIKSIKPYKCYPFVRYEDRQMGLKLKAEVYEDMGGWYELCRGSTQLKCVENGNLKDWLSDVQLEIKKLQTLENFLIEVQCENVPKLTWQYLKEKYK